MKISFGKQRLDEPFSAVWSDNLDSSASLPVSFDQVVAYMVGLSGEDYKKLCKVVNVQRNANKDTAAILGKKVEYSSFLLAPSFNDPDGDIPFITEDDYKDGDEK